MNNQTDWGKLQNLQKTFKRGTELITQGMKPKALYVLISGRLIVYRDGVAVSQVRKRGDYIGEIAVLLKMTASATVKAETEIVVIEIESAKVIPFFNHTPDIAIALARRMAERLVELNSNFSQLIDKAYRPDFIKSLQNKYQQPVVSNSEELNLQKLKPFFVEFAEGMDILTQGQYPSALYILVSGTLEIVKNGKVIAVEDKPGYYLGDVAILRNSFSNATVVTRTVSTLIEIKIEKVENFLNHSPDIAISIAIKLAERTLAINELFLDLQADAVKDILKKGDQLKNEEQAKTNEQIRKNEVELKKDEIRKELAERKRVRDEKEKLEAFSKQKKQDAITNQINEIKKVEQEIYALLGIEMAD
jgi:CRP-like cAMP-binding protein